VAGEAAQAAEYSQQALAQAQSSGMENLTTAGLIDIGNSYFLRGNLSEAEKNFSEALRLAQSYKGKRNEARALVSLASLRTHQSNPSEAAQLAERALTFYQQGGYRKETSQAYAILGHAYDQLGKYDAALWAFEDQLKIAQQVGDPQQTALSHEGLGVVLNHQQNYPAALAHFDEQYSITKTLGNNLVVGYSLMNRGTMLWQLGRYDEAEKGLTEALAIAANPGHEPYTELLAWIRVSKARLALSKRNLPVAMSESQTALKLAGSEFKAIAVQAGSTLGLAQSLAGQTAAGRKSCDQAVELAKTIADPLLLSHALLALAETALNADDAEIAISAAQELEGRLEMSRQHESQWRAVLIDALAQRKQSNEKKSSETSARASKILAALEAEWGPNNYKTYLARPDVQELLRRSNRTGL